MADLKALFNNQNKIRMSDLSDSLTNTLAKGLITESDRRKLDSLTDTGGAMSLGNPLKFKVKGEEITFDGTQETTIDLDSESLGLSKEDHNHDEVYSKLDHEHSYAGSEESGGAANSAKKLDHEVNVVISGAVTGNAKTDVSGDIEINTLVNHEHNYAGSEFPMGPANSAKKLTAPVKITLKGGISGEATTDGSTNIEIETIINEHEHHEYAEIDHNHDEWYSKIGHNHDEYYSLNTHTHNYAGSNEEGGSAIAADAFSEPVTITVGGAVTGSAVFQNSGEEIVLQLERNHTHPTTDIEDFPQYLPNEYNLSITHNGEVLGTYNGTANKDIDIPTAVLIYGSWQKFPETGKENILYIDLGNARIYAWTGTDYKPLGLQEYDIRVIDCNLA